MNQSTSSTQRRSFNILNLFTLKKDKQEKVQTGNLYRDLQKLPILRFWEIVKSNNYFLLDADYFDGKAYSAAQAVELDTLWGSLYDKYYLLKKNYSSAKAMDACKSATLLLSKIELLRDHLDAFVRLYENHKFISEKDFMELKQEMLATFVRIEGRIVPRYFGSLEDNYTLIMQFIESFEMTYSLENPKAEKLVEDEVANVHKRAAKVGDILSGMYFDIQTMSVMAWEGYEEAAIEKLESEKTT